MARKRLSFPFKDVSTSSVALVYDWSFAVFFIKDINGMFKNTNNWFKASLLSLNFDKTSLIQFLTKNSSLIPISVVCNNKIQYNITNIKFLGKMIDKTLMWKSLIGMIIPKLNVACFAVRAIKPFVSPDTLKKVYHSYFHSIINYRIIFWGISSYSNSIFELQKRSIRIIIGVGIKDSCRKFFKTLNILPLISQYIFPLLLFVVNNKNQFQMNSELIIWIPGTVLISINHCHIWVFIRNVPFYMGIKVHNGLPPKIKDFSHNIKIFNASLRGFLYQHSFYTLDE